MSVSPEETAAFANILGKLNDVEAGQKVVNSNKSQRMANNDMHSILSAFSETSGTPSALRFTPEMLAESSVDEAKAKNPYAIGMAQAMKSTGDKPPLKKSTITKAHDIAKAIQKDESVEDLEKSLAEQLSNFKEDTLSKERKSLSDYLGDSKPREEVVKAIKTIKTNDGKELKIYGNEDDGFRVKVNNKNSKNVFDSYEDAIMACETFVAKDNNDYVDEK